MRVSAGAHRLVHAGDSRLCAAEARERAIRGSVSAGRQQHGSESTGESSQERWDAGESELPEDGELHLHGRSGLKRRGAVDSVADATRVCVFAEQPPGGHQRSYYAVAERTADGAGRKSGIGGTVCAGPVLPDRLLATAGAEPAPGTLHGAVDRSFSKAR